MSMKLTELQDKLGDRNKTSNTPRGQSQAETKARPMTGKSQQHGVMSSTIYDNFLEELKIKRWKTKNDRTVNATAQ